MTEFKAWVIYDCGFKVWIIYDCQYQALRKIFLILQKKNISSSSRLRNLKIVDLKHEKFVIIVWSFGKNNSYSFETKYLNILNSSAGK